MVKKTGPIQFLRNLVHDRTAPAEAPPSDPTDSRVPTLSLPLSEPRPVNRASTAYRIEAPVVRIVGTVVGALQGVAGQLPFHLSLPQSKNDRWYPLARVALMVPQTKYDTPEVLRQRQREREMRHIDRTFDGPTSTMSIKDPARVQFRQDLVDQLYGDGAAKKEKQAFILIGMRACGKSTVSAALAAEHGALNIDGDDIRDRIPEFDMYKLGRPIRKEKGEIRDRLLDRATENGDNILLNYAGTVEKDVAEMQALKAKGYTLHLVHLTLPFDKVMQRSLHRLDATGGRMADPKDAIEQGDAPAAMYEKYKHDPLFATYTEYSTDVPMGAPARLLETGVN